MSSLGIIVSVEGLLLWCQRLHLVLHRDSDGVVWELESDVLAELPLELFYREVVLLQLSVEQEEVSDQL